MTLGIPSLTIYFHPENKALWEFLQTLSPMQQEYVILQALKEYLEKEDERRLSVNKSGEKVYCMTPCGTNEDFEEDKDDIREEKDFSDSWDLESLFISPDSALGDLIQRGSFLDQENRTNQVNRTDQENRDSVNRELGYSLRPETIPPLKHLFELLGKEDDEDVMQLLRGHQSVKQGAPVAYDSKGEDVEQEETTPTSGDQPLENPECNESKESLLSPKSSSGLHFLLQHVIGEEEDEEVLRYFRSSLLSGNDNS